MAIATEDAEREDAWLRMEREIDQLWDTSLKRSGVSSARDCILRRRRVCGRAQWAITAAQPVAHEVKMSLTPKG
jgi:hypothetical protein